MGSGPASPPQATYDSSKGLWIWTPSGDFDFEQAYSLTVGAVDRANRVTTTAPPLVFNVDLGMAVVPSVDVIQGNAYLPSMWVNADRPLLEGTAEQFATVTVALTPDGSTGPSETLKVQAGSDGKWRTAPASSLASSSQEFVNYSFTVSAEDRAGHVRASGTGTFTVDVKVPQLTGFLGDPETFSSRLVAPFDLSAVGATSFECRLIGKYTEDPKESFDTPFSDCVPRETNPSQIKVGVLRGGAFTLLVRGKDGAGNVDPKPATGPGPCPRRRLMCNGRASPTSTSSAA